MSQKQWVEEEQDLQDQFMEGASVRGDLGIAEFSVCEADDVLAAGLGFLGLNSRKWGWISRKQKLEAQNKASEDDMVNRGEC